MQAFADIVSAERTRTEEGVIVVSLANAEELSAVLQHCTRQALRVTATGGGTKSGWGNRVDADVRIETARMGGVLEHSWQDLTATAGAGTTWAAMQRALAQHGQRVAVDPLFSERATVGGILSTNDCGLLRMRYGALRDLVIGMTIVLADGTIARTGGKVVKNVAGYDLPKLLTGSFGTLGIITDATFRLHPIARDTASFTVRSSEIAALADLMHAVVTSGMSVEAMQVRNEPDAFALDVQFAAVPQALRDHEDRLRELAGPLRLEETSKDFYSAREELFHIEGATVLKLTTLPTKLAALIAGFAQLAAYGVTAQAVGDPAGIVTASIVTPPEGTAAIVDDLRARLHDIGGTVTVLQRGTLPSDIDPWNAPAHPPASLDVMRAIKHEFDPLHLLNRGRFVGGL